MDRKDLAKKLREALFDHIEAERREALQDAAIDRLFEGVLAAQDSSTHEISGEGGTVAEVPFSWKWSGL